MWDRYIKERPIPRMTYFKIEWTEPSKRRMAGIDSVVLAQTKTGFPEVNKTYNPKG
jgi:hypothetical protein